MMHDQTPIRWPAPAKLNLFLHVNGRRPDGYHELSSIMQTISLADTTIEQLEAKVSENAENYEATQSLSEAARPHRHR